MGCEPDAGRLCAALHRQKRAALVCGPDTPGMAPYGGGPVRAVIRNLSPQGPEMLFDVLVAPTGPP